MLRGAKTHLRELRQSDLDKLRQWRNDPEITQFLSNLQISRTQIEAWFREYEDTSRGRFFAIETLEGLFIGYTGVRDINWTDRTCAVDIIIGEKSHQGQGYGQSAIRSLLEFAFDDIEMTKVRLTVLPFNTRGIRCYEKCGFKRSGQTRDKFFRHGKLWHPILMEISRAQFEMARKVSPA